ncbi:Gamma-interferon-inducible lysosomal thiol reductase [Armadillidium vulgare]|nr:Gamma-interferon-inducible lysosomal thiol reductase [Armadillidium vulgare]
MSCIVKLFPVETQVQVLTCMMKKKTPSFSGKEVNNLTFNEWAMHDLTALVCDAFILNAEEEGKITLPKGCPLFYPAWKNLQSLIDLHLIPFGKANVWLSSNGKQYNFECQHGPLECKGNKILSCIVEYLPTDLQVEMIICMLESSSPSDAGKQCAEKLKLAWEPLEKCYTSEEGSEFLFQNGIRTMSLKPSFYFVPTVTVNKNKLRNEISFEESCRKDEICSSDLILSCVTKYFVIEDQLKFAECQLKTNSSSLLTSKKCAQKLGLSWDVVSKCFRSTESIKLLERNFMKTTHLRPTFHSVPTILFNEYYDKQELLKTRLNFQQTVCKSFYDPSTLEVKKPESCPVTIELFMASLCPDTKRFFLRQAKILNPDSKEYEFNCQHGPLECYGNKVMSCVVKHYSVNDQVQMIACMLGKEYPAIEGRECAEELGLDWEPIMDCFDTESSTLLYQNGLKTQNAKPKIFYIPTSIINGKYNKSIMRKSLRNLSGVCSKELKLDFEEFHSCAQSEKGSKILEEFQENFLKLQNPAKKFPFILIKKVNFNL